MNNIQKATAATAIAIVSFALGNVTSREDVLVQTQTDTIYVDRVDTITQTVYKIKQKIKHDTIIQQVEVPVESEPNNTVVLDTIFCDREQVLINIVCEGEILNKEYYFLKLKDTIF